MGVSNFLILFEGGGKRDSEECNDYKICKISAIFVVEKDRSSFSRLKNVLLEIKKVLKLLVKVLGQPFKAPKLKKMVSHYSSKNEIFFKIYIKR